MRHCATWLVHLAERDFNGRRDSRAPAMFTLPFSDSTRAGLLLIVILRVNARLQYVAEYTGVTSAKERQALNAFFDARRRPSG